MNTYSVLTLSGEEDIFEQKFSINGARWYKIKGADLGKRDDKTFIEQAETVRKNIEEILKKCWYPYAKSSIYHVVRLGLCISK